MDHFNLFDLELKWYSKLILLEEIPKELCVYILLMTSTVISKTSEYVKQYNKEYYAINKSKHLAYVNEKLHCDECACNYSRSKKCAHNRSFKHITNTRIKELELELKSKE